MHNAQKRYRIFFLGTHLYNYFFQGSCKKYGGSSRIYEIVRHLSKNKKYNISCIVGDFGQGREKKIDDILLIKSRIGKAFGLVNICWLLLKHRPDMVIDFYASAHVFLLSLIKKLTGKPFVFFVGNDSDLNGIYRERANRLNHFLYRYGLCCADRIICQTREQLHMLYKTYGLDGEVVLSPYKEINEPQNQERKIILWVGRSAYQKKPEIFLYLASRLPGERFVMICNPDRTPHDRNYIGVKKRAYEIKNVKFIESVPHEKMVEWFSIAKCLVNTSTFEGFPNTFIEAALEHTPIVSLYVDPNKMISHHGAGIHCKGNVYLLEKACHTLANDKELRDKLGKIARQYATAHHDIETAITKIDNVFNEVLKEYAA